MRIVSAGKQEILSSGKEQRNKNNLACMCAHSKVFSTSLARNQWKATSRFVLAKKKKKKKSFKYKNIIKASSQNS